MATLRNLPQEVPQNLADLIAFKNNQVVSMGLSKSDHMQISIFSFDGKENVSEEEYFGDTMYYILEGETCVTKDDKEYLIKAGEVFYVPAHTLHAIGGIGSFKLLQITVNE